MRNRVGLLVALALGCGPSVAGEEGGADGSGESGGTSSSVGSATASTSTSMPSSDATSTTSVTSSDESTVDTGVSFDAGGTETGDPPMNCDPPDNPNSDVSGTTPFGERTYTAAVFAQRGGGKCPLTYEVALAVDPDALASELAAFERGDFPGELAVTLQVPADGVRFGEWEASVRLAEAPGEPAQATATVTIVPNFESPAPLLGFEITTLDPAWDLSGSVAAHYCDVIEFGPCGA